MPPPPADRYDVLIVGGGNAGISLAAKLLIDTALTVAVVAPESDHRYRPLLSYVGGGLTRLPRTTRPQRDHIPSGAQWYQQSVVEFSPDDGSGDGHRVRLDDGRHLVGGDVVLCPGSEVDWDALPGSEQACTGRHGSSNYVPGLAPKTWRLLRGLRSGHAVFAISARNAPCPGVGLKPLFLAADRWRRSGVLEAIDITVVSEHPSPFGLAAVDQRVNDALDRLGVRSFFSAPLREIDPTQRRLSFGTPMTHVDYDALHLTPAHRAPAWIVDSGVADPDSTLVAVDPRTLAHPAYPGLWAIGDVATLDTPSSGGGLRRQVPVVTHNIVSRRLGGPMQHYDGYTVAPIPLSRRTLVLGERDRDGNEQRSVPLLDLGKPRAATLAFDLVLQPEIYWRRLLKGKV